MAKNLKVVWLGDDDPSAQIIRFGDLRFVKGEATDVADDHDFADMIKQNPTFAVGDDKAKPVEVAEPTPEEVMDRTEEGTEKGAIKAQLRAMGITVQGNPSLDTLRNKLVEATK